MNFELFEVKKLDRIPSASGLAKYKAFYYVLGDDSPHLFKLNPGFEVVEKILLFQDEPRERIPKPEKPDFEALELIPENNELIGFGSGSLSPQRDRMIKIKLDKELKVETFSLTVFYTFLKDLDIMQHSELNIEAAALCKDRLHLFNRRKNIIFSLCFSEFMAALESGSFLPPVNALEFSLPEINGIEAGFSGATVSPSGKLVVTCSVENTPNAYDDGEVLGSFVGISSGVKNGIFESLSWTRIASEEAFKVESVSVEREISATELELVMVTDSDGAESVIIKGRLQV
ncbi:DUF6929 family protein [Salinimicrobium xinjiangense]|uniref:DUF6929 family protein n=1 Tax=Salinimicrobium xinjiangense TaxID=438596 RepID=UPI00041BC729|nr:hypothetical protein [Salinimicrobium xinjiangense]